MSTEISIGQTNFITGMIYQPATEHDVRVHEQIVANNQRMGLDPDKLFTDTAYVSGESLKLYQDQGMELMGYLEASSSPRSKEFQPEGFDIDVEQRTAISPGGAAQYLRFGESPRRVEDDLRSEDL